MCLLLERHMKPIMNDGLEYNLKQVSGYFNNEKRRFKGLCLLGTPGNGKSTMLLALARLVPKLAQKGYLKKIRQTMPLLNAKEYKDLIYFKKANILAIDDIGTEPTEVVDFGNCRTPLIDVLEYRYNNNLFTIVASNLTNIEISNKYDKRISDRFNEMFELIVFRQQSYRNRLIYITD